MAVPGFIGWRLAGAANATFLSVNLRRYALAAISVLLLAACDGKNQTTTPSPRSSSAVSSADDGSGVCEVLPDSSAAACGGDWCEEHGVAEADCIPCKERGTH